MGKIDKARSHALRRRILIAVQGRDGPISPSEFARATGTSKTGAAYHFRVLDEIGLIELVGTEPVRGSVQHFYAPGKAFTQELTDAVALDRVADLIEGDGAVEVNDLCGILRASGRPVSVEP